MIPENGLQIAYGNGSSYSVKKRDAFGGLSLHPFYI